MLSNRSHEPKFSPTWPRQGLTTWVYALRDFFLQALTRPSWRKLGFMAAARQHWGWVGSITGRHLRFGHSVLEGIENMKVKTVVGILNLYLF
jgi:hypothetical protein